MKDYPTLARLTTMFEWLTGFGMLLMIAAVFLGVVMHVLSGGGIAALLTSGAVAFAAGLRGLHRAKAMIARLKKG